MIFVGTPVWASQPTPAVNTFLEQMSQLHGQKVCPFVTMGGMGDRPAISKIKKKVEAKGGCIPASLTLKTDKGVNEDHLVKIENFIENYVVGKEQVLH